MASRLIRPLTIPSEEEMDLFEIMAALADPVRRAIIAHITTNPGGACSSSDFGVSKSALTRHWRVLRESGLIRQEVDGTRHRNWVRYEELDHRFPGLMDTVRLELARSTQDSSFPDTSSTTN